ncbi:MAG TPA: DUF480 domain-containing protein [Solirubrobacteraceae bacterium]
MRPPELTAPEQRVLGCLIEKRRTTPDTYPLSINALRLACNQSTNRDPVLDYDEHTVREAAQRLSHRGLARLASGAGSRAIKYRHLAEEGLGLGDQALAVLCVLLLRGPQTPGELKARSERLAHIGSLAEVERLLQELGDRGYVARLPRRPGLKEDRFVHLLRADEVDSEAFGAPAPRPDAMDYSSLPGAPAPEVLAAALEAEEEEDELAGAVGVLANRVTGLETEVAELRSELGALREALGE